MKQLYLGSLVLAFLVAAGPALAERGEDKSQRADRTRKPKFTISKETTYITGPLDKDGNLDYAAALNERLRQGIRPQDNANVLLWHAFGPHPERVTMPPKFFKWLGTPAPPERGDYFLDPFPYLTEHFHIDPRKQGEEVWDEFYRASQRPWTEKQYPHLAAWLKANEKPLALVRQAAQRPHYFSPLVPGRTKPGSPRLMNALRSGVQECRVLANALAARAMLRVGQGRYKEAWQDLLTCHRLGRLVARGGTGIEGLVGIGVDAVASGSDLGFLEGAKLSGKQIKKCLRDLKELPPLPALADRVDLGERFVALDNITALARDDVDALALTGDREPGKLAKGAAPPGSDQVDYNAILRTTNRWYNRFAAALRVKERGVREKRLDQIGQELDNVLAEGRRRPPGQRTAQATGKHIGELFMSLTLPAVRKLQQAADRSAQIERNLHLAFALVAYRQDHGHYPRTLDALAPSYLAHVPGDLFSGKALIYRPSGDGYLLYSVGINGQDEQGRSADDDPPGDDLAVRMPLPMLEGR